MRALCAMQTPLSPEARAPLLALVNATAEWHAGVPGRCDAHVRLLDRVQFTVHRGDCVVVHHDDPASARVLLAALGGHHALLAGRLHGERYCGVGVRIRRCSIPVEAVSAVQDGWQEPPEPDRTDRWRPEVGVAVHLLRASRSTHLSRSEQRQWFGWANRVRHTGGAVVIVAPAAPKFAPVMRLPAQLAGENGRSVRTDLLREARALGYTLPHGDANPRALWLHHGRLCNLRTWE